MRPVRRGRAEPAEAPFELSWPRERAVEALAALARATGWPVGEGSRAPAPLREPGHGALSEALGRASRRLGLEVEAVEAPYDGVERLVRSSGPALLEWNGPNGPALLAVRGSRRGRCRLLGPDLRVRRVPIRRVARWLRHAADEQALPEIERLVSALSASGRTLRAPGRAISERGRRLERARRALLQERLGAQRVASGWLVRLPPGASFWFQARQAGLLRELVGFIGAFAAGYALLLGSWWALGLGALHGRLAADWLLAWGLLLVSLLAPRLVSVWSQARLTAGFGVLLKRHLLAGALRLQPEEIRRDGAGQLLGRVLESEAVEFYALQGGFLAVGAVIELAFSAFILSRGAGGGLHVALLGAWTLGLAALGWRYFDQRCRWTEDRLALTHQLVEGLVGYRTRRAQERREDRNEEEDLRLSGYLERSRRLDRWQGRLLALVPRGWLLLGFCGLGPAWVAADSSLPRLALALGGVLTAYRAFQKLSEGFGHLSGAWISWRQAAPIFHAASRSEEAGAESVPPPRRDGRDGCTLLEARDIAYYHEGRRRPAIDGCSLTLAAGDRVLLEGPSGGGKSTLASVLNGLRQPTSGLLLLDGLDRYSLGAETWRHRVAVAPQFHENHVFTETFAFNLLMGRRWPPRTEDLAAAETLCRELGLGDLLIRMPAGLQQVVGETGWQLSHGERSRLFLARALLQGADLVILDESLAALDPENLDLAISAALKRAPTLLVVAHP